MFRFSTVWPLAWRMLWRDLRAGELTLLCSALVLAIAVLASVNFFVDRMRSGLLRDAAQLLGGDLVINADRPPPLTWLQQAKQQKMQVAQAVTFPSMVFATEGNKAPPVLAAVKAVESNYPLRGTLSVAADSSAPVQQQTAPEPGTVWVDAQLWQHLQLDRVMPTQRYVILGEARLLVAGKLLLEPDRGANFLNFAPRIMLNSLDLPGTALIQPGSRVTYRLLLTGESRAIQQYQAWLQPQLGQGQRVETLESGRPEMQTTLNRAQQFLSLVSLVSALLAALAVALATRRYQQRHINSTAVLRCLGLSQAALFKVVLGEFLILGLLASVVGASLGYLAHFVLVAWLAPTVGVALPNASLWPWLQSLLIGLVVLLGCAFPPLLQLVKIPPLRVLRRDLGLLPISSWLVYSIALLGLSLLLLIVARDLKLTAFLLAGLAACVLLFLSLGWLLLRGLSYLLSRSNFFNRARTKHSGMVWQLALAGLTRRSAASLLQLMAIALGLMALLLLSMTSHDLLTSWRSAAPANAPNRFILNIQPEQKAAVQDWLMTKLQQKQSNDITLYPMVRGRLIAINQRPVVLNDYPDDRARRLLDREFNLSYMDDLPQHNRLLLGRWFDKTQTTLSNDQIAEISMEVGIAKTLNLQLGDVLRFDIVGQTVEARVTSLRQLKWDSMRVNFFAILSPAALENMPQSYITSIHVTPAQAEQLGQLVRQFPNLTILDTQSLIEQIQNVLRQVIRAVEFLFLFTLLSGIVVLYAALASNLDERIHEAAVLRALGAQRRLLARAQWLEFIVLGSLAGLLAAGAASAIGAVLANFIFDLPFLWNPLVLLVGAGAGILCSCLGGWWGIRQVLQQPPLKTLREIV